jgi:RimJ/RimL family protein N-acetyltransferase
LFDSEHLALVVDAVIAGNSPAQVWADDSAAPRAALVWDRTHSVYLVGAVDRPHEWRNLFERQIMPAIGGVLRAHVAGVDAETVFAGYPLQRRERVFYRGARPAIIDWRQPLPAGFRISEINDRFAELGTLHTIGDVIEEIESFWRSVADFHRSGFGFAAHDDETIVCWCTAEYVSDGRCGIGIETVAPYRGRGFATLTASAFVEHAVTPHWDAWTSNLSSVAVAVKVGFDKVETYSILVGNFADIEP